MLLFCVLLTETLAWSPGGFPNQLGSTPPRGWRSWNAWLSDIDQNKMMAAMDGLTKKRPLGKGGKMISLSDLGYLDVGLDGGWFDCGAGVNGSYHNGTTGHLIVRTDKFPSLRQMNEHAHDRGLTTSWYLNADGCDGEKKLTSTHYENDAKEAVAYGFDGVKFDSQRGGPNHNITKWAIALNRTGKQMMIENCLDKHPKYILTDPVHCPFNFYRSGPDNGPSFLGGMMSTLDYIEPFLNVTSPVHASRPGCFAYPDALGIAAPIWGSRAKMEALIHGCSNMTFEEERSLFAAWCIVSSPLILGIDVSNDTEVERMWPIIANELALSINTQWAGSAGHVLKRAEMTFKRAVKFGAACEANRTATFPAWIVWTKPLSKPSKSIAVLAINFADSAQSFRVTFDELVTAGASGTAHALQYRDVWTGKVSSNSVNSSQPWNLVNMHPHSSFFVIFSPVTK